MRPGAVHSSREASVTPCAKQAILWKFALKRDLQAIDVQLSLSLEAVRDFVPV